MGTPRSGGGLSGSAEATTARLAHRRLTFVAARSVVAAMFDGRRCLSPDIFLRGSSSVVLLNVRYSGLVAGSECDRPSSRSPPVRPQVKSSQVQSSPVA